MGYCTNCGNELKDGTLFCPKCGKPVFFKESNRDSSEDSPSYSIELLSFESDMRHQLTKVLTDLLRSNYSAIAMLTQSMLRTEYG